MGQYCNENGNESLPTFLSTGHTVDTFHRLGKYFCFRQQLNSFGKIGDSSGLRFLRTTTVIFFWINSLYRVKAFD